MQNLIPHRFLLTIGLFLIGSLHTMIFAIFQIPGNFLIGEQNPELAFYCKIILYVCAISVSFSHQLLCKKIGLRKTLYVGLLFNLFGTFALWLNHTLHSNAIIILDMIFFGLALTSVINPLITYLVLEFPKRIKPAITALFAFFNVGVMLAPLMIDVFKDVLSGLAVYPALIALLVLGILFIHFFFFDPPYPAHLEHLRKGSIIWKELHYRLGLFVVAIIAYAMTETTFNLIGFIEIKNVLGDAVANETISFFWLFMVVGQIFLLFPLYYLPANRVFFFLILLIITAQILLPYQTHVGGFIAALAIAGFGCSAIFPVLLSLMEKEIVPFAKGSHSLPYIETSTSVMMAGYFIGVGMIDLWVEKMADYISVPVYFHLATAFIAITGLITILIMLTRRIQCK